MANEEKAKKKKVITDLEKSIELARKHEELYGIRNREACCVAACQEMAEWKKQQEIEFLQSLIFQASTQQALNIIIDNRIKLLKGGEK